MSERNTITREYLRSILNYDPETGVFVWRWREGLPDICNHRDAGKEAGTLRRTGYRYICINSRHWAAHRLAFIIMTGSTPVGDIDHINLEKADNRWANLRLATRSQNRGNMPPYMSNTSGMKGVSFHKRIGKWAAYIQVDKVRRHLGYFDRIEDAAKAYASAASQYFGEFARV